jgi:hypothetical protein
MIDLSQEKPIPLEEATSLIPPARRGRRTHFSTIVRWIKNGVLNPSGERVHLEAIRLGGRWMTSREALQRFAERLTPATDTPLPPAPRTTTARQRQSERAARELEKIGI